MTAAFVFPKPVYIFTVQKLTDMVPAKKIFRAFPPGGITVDTTTWWED